VRRVDVRHDRHDLFGLRGRPGRLGRGVDLRQVQGERAARVGRAGQPDLASEEARDLAADGEAEAGPSVLPARRAVRLLESLEDDLLLVSGNSDARVGDGEGNDGARPIERLRSGALAPGRLLDTQ